jgi:hypothetical protein
MAKTSQPQLILPLLDPNRQAIQKRVETDVIDQHAPGARDEVTEAMHEVWHVEHSLINGSGRTTKSSVCLKACSEEGSMRRSFSSGFKLPRRDKNAKSRTLRFHHVEERIHRHW